MWIQFDKTTGQINGANTVMVQDNYLPDNIGQMQADDSLDLMTSRVNLSTGEIEPIPDGG